MMSDETESGDKQHEPTQKKLDDARKKGDVPASTDLTTASVYAGILLVAMTIGAGSLLDVGAGLAGLLERADTRALDMFRGGGRVATGALVLSVTATLAPWFGVPLALALLTSLVTRSATWAPSKLAPKGNRIDPVKNAKNKFGRSGLFEFAKSFVKLVIYSVLVGVFLWIKLPGVLGTLTLSPGMATVVLLELVVQFLAIVLVISLAIGAVDFFWQRAEHMRKNRMSHKEMQDEAKQSEGDPHMKQTRRQRGYEIAMNRMLEDVPDADVVIVNPTHFAVALKWSRAPGSAPVCVAKGVDEVAARIREVAAEAGVPVQRDPPTARALFASTEIGAEIEPEHYRAVAAAIRFADQMRAKMRRRFGRAAARGDGRTE